MSTRARIGFVILVITAGLPAVWSLCLSIYVRTMFENQWTRETLIEGASFASQTITGVGYGNWETPASGSKVDPARILTMRAYSAVLMPIGATIFAFFTGVVVAFASVEPHPN